MKKKAAILLCVFGISLTSAAQTAPDISPVDCHGAAHNLHAELDAGKIIVIGWTMPCSACVPPLLDVHNAVLNFAVSHPGVVEYWVNDDYGNTNCSTVTGWCNNYGITNATYFSTPVLSMNYFGADGMPKVVVMACGDYNVYYNVNDTPTGAGVTAAINQALSDIANDCLLSVHNDLGFVEKKLQPFPNPADTRCSFVIEEGIAVEEVLLTGANGQRLMPEVWHIDGNIITIDVSGIENGMYFLSVQTTGSVELVKIEIKH